jgi:transcriptional regulator of heat shock response
MNQRQEEVLKAIIELYSGTAIPVGSQALLENYTFDVSSATLRNDMAFLETEGYLYQPHISAGRIPTDQGYRFFVEAMGDRELSREDQTRLQKELLMLKAKHMRLGRSTAKLLSAFSGNLAVSGLGDREELYDFGMKQMIDKPEFQDLDDLARLVETLDTLDDKLEKVLETLKTGETTIFIGGENPILGIENCSMIVTPYKTNEGIAVLAIIGPKRMDYAKNKSLIEYMSRLLSSNQNLLPAIIIAPNLITFIL